MANGALTSAGIRKTFIDFFVQRHAHAFVASSPVVPHDDPTLLFTNAGMNQFKPYFLGQAAAPWKRVANTQKCIRAGGKHNDLDDVGRSRRHHTFFEMLGNWSFGDYFKQGAIEMSWELLTKVYQMDPRRLHVSCYEGSEGVPRDTDAAEIWRKVANWEQYGLKSDDHIHYFGKDNFWEMGETGPCGPCTEIYIDRRPSEEVLADLKAGRRAPVNGEDPRVMEIWNNVFIQYNRDASGKLTELPAQHVDTGMGLERLCQVLQQKDDNYGTDLFTPLFEELTKLTGFTYRGKFPKTNAADPVAEAADAQLRHDIAFRVIADHVRCLTFALTDGAVPSNEGRGYVLRRILRRAVRFGRQQLNMTQPFLHTLVPVVVETMGEMFPELKKNPAHVAEIIKDEEVSFGRTIDRGISLFEEAANNAKANDEKILVISGKDAFRLHDTYGFPIDLTRIMAEERGMKVDIAGYEDEMKTAKQRAREGGKEGESSVYDLPPGIISELGKMGVQMTDDSFKFKHGPHRATIRAIWNGVDLDNNCDAGEMRPGEQIAVILDKTNFYAEMGGQIGDAGEIHTDHGAVVEVEATRSVAGYVLHVGHLKSGKIRVNEGVTARVEGGRDKTEKNHTGTHIANWALREVLGDHVQQKGSLVDSEKLRFDFVHQKAMATDEIGRVETLVSKCIEKELKVYAELHPQEQAMKIAGLRAVFGEKYPPLVRVVAIGESPAVMLKDPGNPKWRDFSVEFCGGTHLSNSKETEAFVIIAEESVSKGIRRIVALTGAAAKEAATQGSVIESLISQGKETNPANLGQCIAAIQRAIGGANVPLRAKRHAQEAVAELQEKIKKWQKSEGETKSAAPKFDVEALLNHAEDIGSVKLIVAKVPEASADVLRSTWDWLKKKHPEQNVAAVLASIVVELDKDGNEQPPKVNLLAAVGDPLVGKLKAGDWIKAIVPIIGGTGGGRPQMAMGGGKDVAKLESALIEARQFARDRMSS
jgi:alanyl-tRNA synthetase